MPSSVIRSFDYDPRSRRLLVHFVSGRRYVYVDVPPAAAERFAAASSKGRFFNDRIRDAYAYRELTTADPD